MDMNKVEIQFVKQAEVEVQNQAVIELAELQLAMIGGGSGNDIFA